MSDYKKIKLHFPYDWPLFRQTKNNDGIWEDYRFFIEDTEEYYDFWVFCGNDKIKNIECRCPSNNIILHTWEPQSVKRFSPKFLKQFPNIITCQKSIKINNVIYGLGGHPWFVDKTYEELSACKPMPKQKKMSIVISNKKFTRDHVKRIELAYKLKEYFGDEVDIFGRGIREFDDKWDVLAPYKYSLVMENDFIDHWMTEKIHDAHLAYTFPFYYGCPNAEDYLPSKSFQRIDINNLEDTIQAIKRVFDDDMFYEDRLVEIEKARDLYLDEYQFFPLITSQLRNGFSNSCISKNTIFGVSTMDKVLERSRIIIKKFIN